MAGAEREIGNTVKLLQTEHHAGQATSADRGVAALCRCYRSLDPPPGPHWLPQRDQEPGPQVRVVTIYGEDPRFLWLVRVPEGWHCQGSGANYPNYTPPKPWRRTGDCWAGNDHPVVEVIDHLIPPAVALTPEGHR